MFMLVACDLEQLHANVYLIIVSVLWVYPDSCSVFDRFGLDQGGIPSAWFSDKPG